MKKIYKPGQIITTQATIYNVILNKHDLNDLLDDINNMYEYV